jgi:type IV pilus assembly protein PilY1
MQLKTKIAAGAGLVGLAAAAVVAVMAAAPFVPAQQPIGYVGQPVASSANVGDGNARMFSIDYNAGSLTGNLHSYKIGSNGNLIAGDLWEGGAAGLLAARLEKPDAARTIVTMSDGTTPDGIPFQWSSLTATQRAAIDPATAQNASSSASPILNYLRGDKTGEGTTYRARSGPFGTIIHSTPVYWKDGSGNETVYVGANDGMMHAIDAVSGEERFAYVPKTLIPRLSALSSKTFTPQYFVDGRLDIRKFSSNTVLIGTLGGGGKGIYALDVTNGATANESVTAAKVMWEITETSAGFANLGDTYGAPVLTKLLKKRAATANDKDEFYDALVIGNGYNNKGSGGASLYVIDAQTGALIKEFTTTGGSAAAPNGLSSPSLWDNDEDGVKDTAYAGDIDGNMWKFDLNNLASTPVLIHEREDSNAARAITSAPGLTAHPNGGVLVAFVTGRLLTPADMIDETVHYAYGIRDLSGKTGSMITQTLTEYPFGTGVSAIRTRVASSTPMDWTKNRGWKVALPKGERVVGDGVFIMGDVFQFFSTNPTITPTAKPPGENWWMQLNWRNGGGTDAVIFDLNYDGKFTSADMVKVGEKIQAPVGRHMGGGVRSQLVGFTAGNVDVFQSNFDQNDAPKPDTVDVTTTTVGGGRGVAGGHFDTDIFCYDKCGGFTSQNYVTDNSSAGVFSRGRQASTGDVANLNYIHVHEYDDIYDVLGLNMLHPSQDEQRLSKVLEGSATETDKPDFATHVSAGSVPPEAKVISTSAWDDGSLRNKPEPSNSYTNGAATQDGATAYKTDANGNVTSTTVFKYTSTRTATEYRNIAYNRNSGRYDFDVRTVITTWTTTNTVVLTTPNTSFKVLLANQANSPALKLSIEGTDAASIYKGSVTGFQTGSGLSVSTLPLYKLNAIKDMTVSMPLDAFVKRDWANNGIIRNGVHPIRPQCAGVTTGTFQYGKNGEWRNGALTVQVVKGDIAQSDVQLNVAGKPEFGYRLQTAKLKDKLIAEYLIFWHNPAPNPLDKNSVAPCMNDASWTYAVPPDNKAGTAKQGTPAAGALDPKGKFEQGDGDPPPPTKPATDPAPVVTPNADGSTTTTTVKYTDLAGGGYTIETTVKISWPSGGPLTGIVTGGAVSNGSGGSTPDPKCVVDCKEVEEGQKLQSVTVGRINWRELQR